MSRKHMKKRSKIDVRHIDLYQPEQPKFKPVYISPRTKNQKDYLRVLQDTSKDIILAVGPAGSGKTLMSVLYGIKLLQENKIEKIIITRPAVSVDEELGFLPGPQPLDAKILTPYGWTTMGNLSVGDFVIGRDGTPTKVLGIFPKGKKLVYKITTTDGTSTEACEDHLWYTSTLEDRKRGRDGCVKTTRDIMNSLVDKNGKYNHILPRNEAINFTKQELPIPPYILGALLGDGCMTTAVCISNMDDEIITRVNSELSQINCRLAIPKYGISYYIRGNLKFNKPAKTVILKNSLSGNEIARYDSIGIASRSLGVHKATIQSRCKNSSVIDGVLYSYSEADYRLTNPIKNELYNLGLQGKTAYDKFIPNLYKFSNINDRLDLLRGLLDTNGTVKKSGEASYTTVSKQLASDIIEVVRSLGGRASLCVRYRVGKKSLINNRNIRSSVPSYEFTISLPEHLNPFYISRKAERWSQKYIPSSIISSIEPIEEKEVQCILVESDEHLYITDEYIVTHNTLEEKMAPWTRPIFDVFSEYFQKNEIEKYMNDGIIEISPLAYMRGRAEPLTSLIPTPNGFTKMGDIKEGDYVLGSNGQPTLVHGVYPQGKIPVADVHFSDGSVVRCSKDHLWNTRSQTQRSRKHPYTTKTTTEIQEKIRDKHGRKLHEIPMVSAPVSFPAVDVPIDPYVLGCILGDGCVSGNSIQFSTADDEMIQLINERLPENMTINKIMSSKPGYGYTISKTNNATKNVLKKSIIDLKLWGLTAIDKHIPELYLHNDATVRLELLRGLMDTDGSVFYLRSGKTRVQFYSISEKLAAGVKFLVESLGGVAKIRVKPTPKNGTHRSGFGHNYDVNVVNIALPLSVNPFRLSRKRDIFEPSPILRFITDVVDVGEEECQCISVDANDSLYLTNNFIVTHNTFKKSFIIFDEAQDSTPLQMKMALTRIAEGSKMVVTGDLAQHDRGLDVNGLGDFIHKIKDKGSDRIATIQFDRYDIQRHPVIQDILSAYGDE